MISTQKRFLINILGGASLLFLSHAFLGLAMPLDKEPIFVLKVAALEKSLSKSHSLKLLSKLDIVCGELSQAFMQRMKRSVLPPLEVTLSFQNCRGIPYFYSEHVTEVTYDDARNVYPLTHKPSFLDDLPRLTELIFPHNQIGDVSGNFECMFHSPPPLKEPKVDQSENPFAPLDDLAVDCVMSHLSTLDLLNAACAMPSACFLNEMFRDKRSRAVQVFPLYENKRRLEGFKGLAIYDSESDQELIVPLIEQINWEQTGYAFTLKSITWHMRQQHTETLFLEANNPHMQDPCEEHEQKKHAICLRHTITHYLNTPEGKERFLNHYEEHAAQSHQG